MREEFIVDIEGSDMLETRQDHEYAARVWMQKTLGEAVEREALARIEAMLPGGYRYRIERGSIQGAYNQVHEGWVASFGDTRDGSGWGIPHAFRTKIGATVGLLAMLCDGCVFPGCSTSFGRDQAVGSAKRSGRGEGDE